MLFYQACFDPKKINCESNGFEKESCNQVIELEDAVPPSELHLDQALEEQERLDRWDITIFFLDIISCITLNIIVINLFRVMTKKMENKKLFHEDMFAVIYLQEYIHTE